MITNKCSNNSIARKFKLTNEDRVKFLRKPGMQRQSVCYMQSLHGLMFKEWGYIMDKIQWHPGFCAAMELEFRDNHSDLEYQREYNLSKKPLQIDFLIIKKKSDTLIRNEIGSIFRSWNIMEYKSPDDSMDIDDFYKVQAYACLFKSQAEYVNRYPASEITITMVRMRYPQSLIQTLRTEGFTVNKRREGIFAVEGNIPFQTQIIITGQLMGADHVWLRSLTNKIDRKDFRELTDDILSLKKHYEMECADAVLEIVTSANSKEIRQWKPANKKSSVF